MYVDVASDIFLHENKMTQQENGMDLFYVTDSRIVNNNASNNVGWGIHLYKSAHNVMKKNVADQ